MADIERTTIETVEVAGVHSNTAQELIRITEDKLRLKLLLHLSKIERTKEWQVPASLLIGVVLTLTTADAKDAFGISKYAWQALFLMIAVLSLIWLICTLVRLGKKPTLEKLILSIKSSHDAES